MLHKLSILCVLLALTTSQAGNSVLVIRGSGGGAPACANDPCANGAYADGCLLKETFEATSGNACDTGYSDAVWTEVSGATASLGCDNTENNISKDGGAQSLYAAMSGASDHFRNVIGKRCLAGTDLYKLCTTSSDCAGTQPCDYLVEGYVAYKLKPITAFSTSVDLTFGGHMSSTSALGVSITLFGTTDKVRQTGPTGCTGDVTATSYGSDGTTYFVVNHYAMATSNTYCLASGVPWACCTGSGSGTCPGADGECDTAITSNASATEWPSSAGSGYFSGTHSSTGATSNRFVGVQFQGGHASTPYTYVLDEIQVSALPIDPCALQ